MNRFVVAAATALTLGTTHVAYAETWGMDPTHTDVIVSWDHAGFSRQAMSFYEFDGTLELDLQNVEALKADFTIPVASLSTGFDMFDTELKGAGFFDAETHPVIRFVSTSVEQTSDMTASVTGDLTIKGVTKPATFDVTVHKIGEHPVGQFFEAYQGNWIGFTAEAEIMRSEWGVDAFIPVGSDAIKIEINSEMREGGFSMEAG